MTRRLLCNNRGVCLAEMMIALTAGAVVLAAAVQSLTHFERRLSVQQGAMGRHQDLRIGLSVIGDELRLADTGSSGTFLLTADQQEVAFLANLQGGAAILTEAAHPGQQELRVDGATDWRKGKRIVLCAEDDCAETRLTRDGQGKSLFVNQPLDRPFPAGSKVWQASYLRYYLGKDSQGRPALMRQVDGGANSLIGEISSVRFRYLDKEGKPTGEPASVAVVRLELGVGGERQIIVKEVGLRAI
ncbi:MAG: sugar ABC transporter permease [Nitrospira sp.]|nr:sugar ABC transporter permease [Nitrospira sp.]